jgi:hypothetical protein
VRLSRSLSAVRGSLLLPERFAIISPKSRWDIFEDDEDSVRGNATSGSNKFGQLGAERVSFRVRNTDAPELKEGRDGIVTPEYHLRTGMKLAIT